MNTIDMSMCTYMPNILVHTIYILYYYAVIITYVSTPFPLSIFLGHGEGAAESEGQGAGHYCASGE